MERKTIGFVQLNSDAANNGEREANWLGNEFALSIMKTNGDETNANAERPSFVYRRMNPGGSDNKPMST